MKNFVHKNFSHIVVSIWSLLLSLTGPTAKAATWYVKPGGAGTGTTSWANAASGTQLAAIIAGAASGDQVWVVAGTYYPTTSASRTISFVLKSGVSVYGGFAGTETLLTQRNFSTNVTILSGDIGVAGNSTDNTYNVVVSTSNTGTAVLDGFTITGGNANGAGQNSLGGGAYNYNTTVNYSNCTFKSNKATGNGGALYAYGTTVTFTACTFDSNTTSADGGGLLIDANGGGGYTLTSCTISNNVATGNGGGLARENGSVTVTITGCSFTGNTSNNAADMTGGGGVYLMNGGLTMTNCTVSNNTTSGWGGGILYNQGSSSPITITTFSNNNARKGGGLVCYNGSAATVNNCNFTKNQAVYGGGAYYNNTGSPTFSTDTFSQNKATNAGVGGGGMLMAAGSNAVVLHSLFLSNVATGDGAGQYDSLCNVIDSECVINANVAGGNGGGIVYNGNNPKSYNCVISDNQCTGYGGGMYITNSNGTVMSCTFYNNASTSSTLATPYGDGIYYLSGNFKLYSSIVWSSTSSSVGMVLGGSSESLSYDDIQNDANLVSAYGSYASNNNISSTPVFGNAGNYVGADGMWATSDDGLHQVTSSPAADIEPNNSSGNTKVTAYDITMSARPYSGNTFSSMGAYEGPGGFLTLTLSPAGLTALVTDDHTVTLSWQAALATDGTAYEVQRSTKGANFAAVSEVAAIKGQNIYTYKDDHATGTLYYYRLRTILPGGGELISPTVMIQRSLQLTGRPTLRPSFTRESKTVLYIAPVQPMSASLTIIDASGHVLSRWSVALGSGENYIPVDLSGLVSGLYYLSITGERGVREVLPFGRL